MTFHNPQATAPLDHAIFNGPFDEQWAAVNGMYMRATAGSLVETLPQ